MVRQDVYYAERKMVILLVIMNQYLFQQEIFRKVHWKSKYGSHGQSTVCRYRYCNRHAILCEFVAPEAVCTV